MVDQPTLAQLLFQDSGQALKNGFINGARSFGDQALSAIGGQQPPQPYAGGTTPNQYVGQNWGVMAEQGRLTPDFIAQLVQNGSLR